jgi:hypothetical protein
MTYPPNSPVHAQHIDVCKTAIINNIKSYCVFPLAIEWHENGTRNGVFIKDKDHVIATRIGPGMTEFLSKKLEDLGLVTLAYILEIGHSNANPDVYRTILDKIKKIVEGKTETSSTKTR